MTDRRRDRLYRFLVRLFPASFRQEFGDAMTADFEDEQAAARPRGRAALLRLWLRTVPGLVAAGARAWIDDLVHDLRFALRTMARSPGFTAAAIFMLALGTGANAAVFSIVDAVVLRSGIVDPARVVLVLEQRPGHPPMRFVPLEHLPMLAAAPALAAVAAQSGSLPVLTGTGEPHRVDIECVSAAMFPLLGTAPILGRTFTEAEDRAGADAVIVLTYAAWRQEFGARADVIGRVMTLNGRANTVIGVMPEGYLGPMSLNRTAGFAPLQPALANQSAAGCQASKTIDVFARVKAPLTVEQAAAALNASGLSARLPFADGGTGAAISFERADTFRYPALRGQFLALVGAVVCVLLIACANVANLQLERLIGRRRELAVRASLGASRGRLVRQTLTENLLLALLGAAAGLLAGAFALHAVVGLLSDRLPRVADITINVRTAAATFGVALAAALAVGLVPALQSSRPSFARDLQSASRSVAGSGSWIRRVLVVGEVAIAVVLVAGAALTVRTFLALRPIDPGFDPTNRLVAEILLDGHWQVDPARGRFFTALIERARALPGVRSASGSSYLPFSGVTTLTNVRGPVETADVWTSWITPDFVRDIGMSLIRGRGFTATDGPSAQPVALVNEAFAHRFYPAADAVGRILDVRTPDGSRTPRQVVGILHDARAWGTDLEHRAELYVPYEQGGGGSTLLYLVLRTAGPQPPALAPAIRAMVSEIRPGQVVESIEPFTEILARGVSQPRFGAWLFGLFAALAVVLAASGLAAVITWWVAQRTREIGIRVALGAAAADIVRAIVGQGLLLAGAGTLIGTIGAIAAMRLLTEWLYGVTPIGPETFATAALATLAIAALASYLPARRAATVDPLTALRSE